MVDAALAVVDAGGVGSCRVSKGQGPKRLFSRKNCSNCEYQAALGLSEVVLGRYEHIRKGRVEASDIESTVHTRFALSLRL